VKFLILLFGVALALAGLFGVLLPTRFKHVLGEWRRRSRFLIAVSLRFVIGAILVLVADELRFSDAMQVLGVIIIAAGFGTLMIGEERLNRFVDWWLGRSDLLIRASMALATVFGLFLVYVTL
jgi:hypothetical protein